MFSIDPVTGRELYNLPLSPGPPDAVRTVSPPLSPSTVARQHELNQRWYGKDAPLPTPPSDVHMVDEEDVRAATLAAFSHLPAPAASSSSSSSHRAAPSAPSRASSVRPTVPVASSACREVIVIDSDDEDIYAADDAPPPLPRSSRTHEAQRNPLDPDSDEEEELRRSIAALSRAGPPPDTSMRRLAARRAGARGAAQDSQETQPVALESDDDATVLPEDVSPPDSPTLDRPE
jgi:hypothetical protein